MATNSRQLRSTGEAVLGGGLFATPLYAMNRKYYSILVLILLTILACDNTHKTMSAEDWYKTFSKSSLIDSVKGYTIVPRNEYIIIFLGEDSLEFTFIIDSSSTMQNFNYRSRINDVNYDYKKNNNPLFPQYMNEAKKVFNYYLKLGKIEFVSYKDSTNKLNDEIRFHFNNGVSLAYFPNYGDEMLEWLNKHKDKANYKRLDKHWFKIY